MKYDQNDIQSTSRGLAYLLRHDPAAANLVMDENGWVAVEQLIANMPMVGHHLDWDKLVHIVENDCKSRYAFSEDNRFIRARQGHSVNVDVELKEADAPDVLWHGTATRFIDAIEEEGLLPMSRLYVHLSSDIKTARLVGSRHGKPVVYEVASGEMSRDGHVFYLSENGVWLCDAVPPRYLRRIE